MRVLQAILLLMPLGLCAQSVVSDDFSDGDFSKNPAWYGDTALFWVNDSLELQLLDSVAGQSYLSTASAITTEASWEFYLRLQFNPSSSNYARFYLISDQPNLQGALHGYYLRLGGSSSDRISLYRQDGQSSQLLLESSDDWLDSSPLELRIKLERDQGLFSLAVDTGAATGLTLIGQIRDSSYYFSSHAGWSCYYTRTRADKFFLDDLLIRGHAVIDSLPPLVLKARALDSVWLQLQFNEILDPPSALDLSNYRDYRGENPIAAKLDTLDSRRLILRFANPFTPNQLLSLIVNGVADRYGNTTYQNTSFYYYRPRRGDLLISEIMADPSPAVGLPPDALPEEEYLEIYNRSSMPLQLEDWQLKIATKTLALAPLELPPGAYLLLCRPDAVGSFPDSLKVASLAMGSNALNNSGQSLSLLGPEGFISDELTYAESWYGNASKAKGGWSLERIDLDNLCEGEANWRASESNRGGTPGSENSVAASNPDTTAPRLGKLALEGDSVILLYFSEELFGACLLDTFAYRLTPRIAVRRVEKLTSGQHGLRLQLAQPLESSVLYRLWIDCPGVDCAGNALPSDSLLLGIPEVAQPGDVLINEILFNPLPGGSDFVELYNASGRLLDLRGLRLGNWDEEGQLAFNLKELSAESRFFPPHSYLALSEDYDFLADHYQLKFPGQVIELPQLPSLPDKQGSLALCNSALINLDYLDYSADWHSPLLNVQEGVSLERLSVAAPAQQADNWHSAAATAGFATPGYQNSQLFAFSSQGSLALQPRVFSPNQDGYHDVLFINYRFSQPGSILSLSVWSSDGLLLRELQRQRLVGSEGFFTWDGCDQAGNRLNSGIYIIVAEVFNPAGGSETIRKSCVLSL